MTCENFHSNRRAIAKRVLADDGIALAVGCEYWCANPNCSRLHELQHAWDFQSSRRRKTKRRARPTSHSYLSYCSSVMEMVAEIMPSVAAKYQIVPRPKNPVTWSLYEYILSPRLNAITANELRRRWWRRFSKAKEELAAFLVREEQLDRGRRVQGTIGASFQVTRISVAPWCALPTAPAFLPGDGLIGTVFMECWAHARPFVIRTFMAVPFTEFLSEDTTFRIVKRMNNSDEGAFFICNGHGMCMIGGPVESEAWGQKAPYWWQLARRRAHASVVRGVCSDTCCQGGDGTNHPIVHL